MSAVNINDGFLRNVDKRVFQRAVAFREKS